MIYLFVHQNFPAQYVHIVRHLAGDAGNTVYFVTQAYESSIAGVHKLVYRPEPRGNGAGHPYNSAYEDAVRTAMAVVRVCRGLRAAGVVPDVIVGHSGWGETMLIKEVFPDTPLLCYFEFFYHARGADVGFDPEFAPAREDDGVRLRLRNAIGCMSFLGSDWGHTATEWQRSLFPAQMQARITALHEGIDTEQMRPGTKARLTLPGGRGELSQGDEVITYVARNLEPYRGFHLFMRALPEALRRRPRAHAVVVGGDGISYGDHPPYGGTYREMLLAELGERLDRDRVHFLGQVPKETYLKVLQVSAVHVHFTYPFVLSWSVLEAMACGCLVLGSANAPLDHVIRDGHNGLLVDAFRPQEVCERIEAVLAHPDRMQAARDAARAHVVQDFDLKTVTLPRWVDLLSAMAGGTLPDGRRVGDRPDGPA
jgi:glycosyltransferase involved in cell wall biosynthesis